MLGPCRVQRGSDVEGEDVPDTLPSVREAGIFRPPWEDLLGSY